MGKLRLYIQACRPRTLPASLGPVFVGMGVAGIENLLKRPVIVFCIIFCAMLLQISANLVNDYYDHINKVDSPDRIGPTRLSSTGLIEPESIKLSYKISIAIAICLGAVLVTQGGWPIIIIGAMSVVFAYFYTGGPYPLSYLGLGEVLAFIFFGPVAVWGTTYLLSDQSSSMALLAGVGTGSIAWALMGINNMRDRISDKKAGKMTLAVIFGEKISRYIPILGVALSVATPTYMAIVNNKPAYLAVALCFIVFLATWKRVLFSPIDKSQNLSLAATGKFIALYCLTMSCVLFLY